MTIKLQRITKSSQLISEVIDELQQQNWQSQERFAEMLVHARLNQGYGPLRIEQELQKHSIDCDMMARLFVKYEVNDEKWLSQCWHKKFGRVVFAKELTTQKQLRFLLYKGFSYQAAQQWLRELKDIESDSNEMD